MRLIIHDTMADVTEWTAKYILKRIHDFNPNANKYFVLAMGSDSSPAGVYKKLIEYYKAGKVSFRYVKTFNLMEYVGIASDNPVSYYSYTHNNFTDHVDIDPKNVFTLNGTASDLVAECEEYEKKIKEAGGIDLHMTGVGLDGHVAWNVPGSSLLSRTRVKTLGEMSVKEICVHFDNDTRKVPRQVLTVGIDNMMEIGELLFIFNGTAKAVALQKAVEEGINSMWEISAFQQHPRTLLICDKDSTVELRVKTVNYYKAIEYTHSKLAEEASALSK
ncbi:glucosamine-6-phosphate isomerase 2-like [Diprion similis]|uniref:glucosamine-6-phosphate isomerase 2-like n=1 Tax=Diprion similis TaxID=362088 RepID=UPI001EF82D52|nr:glucosamine-6-phosphate isomerase 2-like [Diprion similis]